MSFFRPSSDAFLTVTAPVGFFALTLLLERVIGVRCFTGCEDGPVESFQAIILFTAVALGFSLLRMPRGTYPQWARVFFTLGVIGALYAALEEISYGQRIFGWITPQSWDLVNDQKETNLHNTSAWFDQKPRIVLEIGVFIGGIVIPLLRRWKPSALPKRWIPIYPADALFTTALFAIGVHVYHELSEIFDRRDLFLIDRGSELQETYFFWFMFLYFLFKRREFRASAGPARSAST